MVLLGIHTTCATTMPLTPSNTFCMCWVAAGSYNEFGCYLPAASSHLVLTFFVVWHTHPLTHTICHLSLLTMSFAVLNMQNIHFLKMQLKWRNFYNEVWSNVRGRNGETLPITILSPLWLPLAYRIYASEITSSFVNQAYIIQMVKGERKREEGVIFWWGVYLTW